MNFSLTNNVNTKPKILVNSRLFTIFETLMPCKQLWTSHIFSEIYQLQLFYICVIFANITKTVNFQIKRFKNVKPLIPLINTQYKTFIHNCLRVVTNLTRPDLTWPDLTKSNVNSLFWLVSTFVFILNFIITQVNVVSCNKHVHNLRYH